jgi:hypothetical protein
MTKIPEHFFRVLPEKAIEEKLHIEKKSGRDLRITKHLLNQELFAHEREILNTKNFLNQLNIFSYLFRHRKVLRALLPLEIQAQNLREQIAYIDKKIALEQENK